MGIKTFYKIDVFQELLQNAPEKAKKVNRNVVIYLITNLSV